MTLGFSTQINGKPNYFPQKILKGLPIGKWEKSASLSYFGDSTLAPYLTSSEYDKANPKLHTIRKDEHNRWKAGMDIHFVINNRTENRFQFAPVVKCVSVQRLKIEYNPSNSIYPHVNVIVFESGSYTFLSEKSILKLAINDGFDSVEDFFAYFNTDFKGKIIHWTDLKY